MPGVPKLTRNLPILRSLHAQGYKPVSMEQPTEMICCLLPTLKSASALVYMMLTSQLTGYLQATDHKVEHAVFSVKL
jgi:hypothetical protein